MTTVCVSKAVTDRTLQPPVCNSLHHKVTGSRLASSATAYGLAAWLHHQAGWLFQWYTDTASYGLMYVQIWRYPQNQKYITYLNAARKGTEPGNMLKRFYEDRTCSFGDMLADGQTDGHHNRLAPLRGEVKIWTNWVNFRTTLPRRLAPFPMTFEWHLPFAMRSYVQLRSSCENFIFQLILSVVR